MKKCMIIGSGGYIGKHIRLLLKDQKMNLVCYDINNDSDNDIFYLDLTNKKMVSQIDFNVDYIFLISGQTGTYNGFDNYEHFFQVNEMGMLNLLDAIRNSAYRPKIIYPSTRLVYRGINYPLKEDSEKETKTIYAVNKLACEGLLYAYKNAFDIPYTIFRICVPYGNLCDGDYSFGTVGTFIKSALNYRSISLYGGGEYKRTFTHIKDICTLMIKGGFHECSDGNVYNIGGEILLLKDVATLIANKLGANVCEVPWPEKDKKIEAGHTYFDDSNLMNLLGHFSYVTIDEYSDELITHLL